MNSFLSRNRLLIIGLVLALLSAGVFYLRSSHDKAEARNDVVAASPSPALPVVHTSNTPSTTSPPPRMLTVSSSEDEDATISIPSDRPRFIAAGSTTQRRAGQEDVDLRKASTSLRDYRLAFKQNPVGNNAEITRALSGKNSRGTRYLSTDAHINDKGQLTDRWDQPVFFHQISASIMEVRSAGPDRVMWTADDEVLR